jgi:hypothetical protein
MFTATSQFRAPCGKGENTKIIATSGDWTNSGDFSPPTSSVIVPNSPASSNTIAAREMRPETVDFGQNREKVENLPTSTPTTPRTPSPATSKLTYGVPRVYTRSQTPKDVILHPITLPTAASSSLTPYYTEHQKSASSRVDFEPQPHTESSALTSYVTALETRQLVPGFTKNRPKSENLPLSSFAQKSPEPPVSTRFIWADDATHLPILSTVPAKPPRDLSSLRSRISQKIHFHPSNVAAKNSIRKGLIFSIQSLNAVVAIHFQALLLIFNTLIIIYNLPQLL